MGLRVAGSSLGLTGWSGLTATNVLYAASATTVGQDGNFTFNGTALSVPELSLGALSTIHFTGLTANALLLSDGTDLTQDGTNLLYTTASGPRLQVGSGSGANMGWFIANHPNFDGFAALWTTAVTPGTNNYVLMGTAGDTYLNAIAATNIIYLQTGNSTRASVGGAAGAGFAITAGIAATDVNALSATQTWNAGAVAFRGWRFLITDTASAAGSLALQILGGAAAATNLLSVSKVGLVDAPAYAVAGAAGASGTFTSVTVVNGIVTAGT